MSPFRGGTKRATAEKAEQQIPRGLKPARDDKGLDGAPEGAPLQNSHGLGIFSML
jgi:hypothetical protein